MSDELKSACCFCGEGILRTKFDPGELAYTPGWPKRETSQTQGLYCHAKCFEAKLHPSAKLYVLSIVDDESD